MMAGQFREFAKLSNILLADFAGGIQITGRSDSCSMRLDEIRCLSEKIDLEVTDNL